jgi:hypothetical protein
MSDKEQQSIDLEIRKLISSELEKNNGYVFWAKQTDIHDKAQIMDLLISKLNRYNYTEKEIFMSSGQGQRYLVDYALSGLVYYKES